MVNLKRAAAHALVVGAVGLAGCSSTSLSTDKIDYKSVAPPKTLEVPPDLTQLPKEDRYAVPDRPGVASANAGASVARPVSPVGAAPLPAVAPASPRARIERAGSTRWLAVDVPPEKAFETVKEFWPAVGLNIEREDPAAGIVETTWGENRAKLPQDIIRATLGKVLDSVYSTGEQDKFRARVERTATNTSEIYISHRGMKEVATGNLDGTIWQPRPSDPELEAEMLQRLALRFAPPVAAAGTSVAAAPTPAGSAVATPAAPPPLARLVKGADGKASRVDIDEPFDRAWRRVGLALDRGGFTIEDRDRTKGLYFVRYLDPDYETKQRESQGFFSKMFGKDPKIEAQQFRVILSTDLTPTQASVLDKDGKPDAGATAQKILGQLVDQLK
jgi:outer membrane protein assembly factor BamC